MHTEGDYRVVEMQRQCAFAIPPPTKTLKTLAIALMWMPHFMFEMFATNTYEQQHVSQFEDRSFVYQCLTCSMLLPPSYFKSTADVLAATAPASD